MEYSVTKDPPCSVCDFVAICHDGWYLVREDRWLDRLKILTWHSSLAGQSDVRSACCRQHLKVLMAHWLTRPSLSLVPTPDNLPMPAAEANARTDNPALLPLGQLVGELSVHRETRTHSWTGSPATLECILEALIPVSGEDEDRHDESFCPLFNAGEERRELSS